ncbi:hypothetical protein D046_6198B, partial [Vibrio parahaemolyticus V-223/04]
SFAVFGYFRK